MQYKIKPINDRFFLYQKVLFWWMPCFTVANCIDSKCIVKVSAGNVDTLISHCKAKNPDMVMVKGWDNGELLVDFVEGI